MKRFSIILTILLFSCILFSCAPPISIPSPFEPDFPPISEVIKTGQHPYSSVRARLNFFLYLPEAYGNKTEETWPLILFLHATANTPDDSMQVLRQTFLTETLEGETDFPFIVLSPRVLGEFEFWAEDEMVDQLITLLDEVQSSLSVDPARVYLTGVSSGGHGALMLGIDYPDRFAAIVPVMAYFSRPFIVPKDICNLQDIPVWAFHGEKDEVVELESALSLVVKLKACGGDGKLTLISGAGHDVNPYHRSEMFEWMLSHASE